MDQPIRKLFDPVAMPARDDQGFATHPDMLDDRWQHPVLGDEYMNTLALAEAGFAWTFHYMSSDVDAEAMDRYGEDCDCNPWSPPDRSADGWVIASIYDHEDGAIAVYVRPIEGDEQDQLIAAEQAEMRRLEERYGKSSP